MAEDRRTRVFSAPSSDAPKPDHTAALTAITRATAASAAALAGLATVGWIVGVPALARLAPGLPTMKLNTALALLLLALAYVGPRTVALTAAALALVFAVAELVEHAAAVDLGIDQALVTDHTGGPPGRAALTTALGITLLAAARLTDLPGVAVPRRRRRAARQTLALLGVALAGLAVLGYLYGARPLYTFGTQSIALPTAVALLLLGAAALASTPRGAAAWVLFAPDQGAALARRLGLVAVVGLPLVGLCVVGVRHLGGADGATAIALTVILCVAAFGLAVWLMARRIARIDVQRQATLDDLADLKRSLELQVAARAELLRSRHDEIAVLQDRQRIAADIHDVVIQRLFAAGMFLHGAPASDDATQQRIETAIESMDSAIKELRASIFELGGHATRQLDLLTALDDVCTEVSRVLGFRPDLVVDDPDREADAVSDDILAVTREALSNVARHAGASAVDVVLRTGSGLISLTVTDDGRGIESPPHSSGTRNMAERARRRGGDCVWTTVEPHGTRVWWHVPGTPAHLDDAAGASAGLGGA